jgi:hypothetical protein
MKLDVFLDESGVFLETLPFHQMEHQGIDIPKRLFASQVAGVVAEHGSLNSQRAQELLAIPCRQTGMELMPEFHANYIGYQQISALVPHFAKVLRQTHFQAVRLVNRERLSFGTRVSTYCNMIAELLIKICEHWDSQTHDVVQLHVYSANFVSRIQADEVTVLDQDEYLFRIQELFARTAVSYGFSAENFRWSVVEFNLISARRDRRLQLADLISYSTHDGFHPLRESREAKNAMVSVLGKCDWSFSINKTLNRVEQLESAESFGLALITLADQAIVANLEPVIANKYKATAINLVKSIGKSEPGIQRSHFQVIAGWLYKVAEDRCELDESLKKIEWIQKILTAAPDTSLPPANWPSDWLGLLTATHALSACNHAGNTLTGAKYSMQIDDLTPQVALRWEYTDDLMHAFITQAVHRNDCCDYLRASERMESVGRFYETMNTFFKDAFPGVFPEKVHADLAGRAFGTQVQCETACVLATAGEKANEHLVRGRKANKLATAEFESEQDKSRQRQYRCELETAARNYPEARSYLAAAIGIPDSNHQTISNFLDEMPNGFNQGFQMLHWCRIGAMAGKSGDSLEFNAFLKAWQSSKLKHSTWASGLDLEGGKATVYPSHGILRHLSVIAAVSGDAHSVQKYLANLERVVTADRRPLFELIAIAANLESLALHQPNTKIFHEALMKLLQRISTVQNQVSSTHREMGQMLTNWLERLKGSPSTDTMLCLGRMIGY